jgi:protoheme IX farnesyltransferase
VLLLVLAQGFLGARSVSSALNLPTVQAHIGVGVALLAAHWGLYLGSAPPRTRAPVRMAAWARDIVALTKPRVTGLVLATFGGGLALAPGHISSWRAVLAVLGTVLIVGAANAWNMFLERDVDGLMKRTRGRPLPQGRLNPDAALALGTTLATIALPLLALGANGLTALLGLFAFASYVFAYTPLKQRSTASLYVGAVPGAMPPLMGWTAVTGALDAPGLALFAVLFLWQIPHFLAIAMFRTDEYAGAGFKVMPAVHGPRASRVCAVVFAVATLVASLALQPLGVAGWTYTVGAFLLGAAFVAWGVAGLSPGRGQRWARGFFAASLLYLVALFAALAVDRLAS